MGRSLLSIFLLLALLFSGGQAAPTFHNIWNLVLPSSTSPAEAVPDHLPHGEVRSLPAAAGEAGDHSAADEVSDHSKTQVDFGTKAWPYVYYARRDRQGTVDWGTKSWPYIFYSKREDSKDDLVASSNGGGAAHYGRKVGSGLRL